jgi:hypothetical protein
VVTIKITILLGYDAMRSGRNLHTFFRNVGKFLPVCTTSHPEDGNIHQFLKLSFIVFRKTLKFRNKFRFHTQGCYCVPLYRVIHKSVRDIRRLGTVAGIVTGGGGVCMSTEGETPQVSVVLCGTWSETSVVPSQLTQFWQIARHRTLSYPLSTPCFVTTAP